MRIRALGLSLIVLLSASGLTRAQSAQDRIPVIAELFTSEGCSSCPPADELLQMWLQEQPIKGVYIVALSEHVTYWDHQGWKDPFSAQQFTVRQQQYGLRFNLDSIYTPQLIVDGTREFVGSEKRAIERALTDAAKTPKPALHVAVTTTDGSLKMTASGPGLTAEKDAELIFAVTEDHLVIDVPRGENAKRTLKHSGVVRWLSSAGEIGAATATVKIAPDWHRENLRVVAFVQSKKNRRVISAATGLLASPAR
jgi:hypothetical protein